MTAISESDLSASVERALKVIDEASDVESLQTIRDRFRYQEDRRWNYNLAQIQQLEEASYAREKSLRMAG